MSIVGSPNRRIAGLRAILEAEEYRVVIQNDHAAVDCIARRRCHMPRSLARRRWKDILAEQDQLSSAAVLFLTAWLSILVVCRKPLCQYSSHLVRVLVESRPAEPRTLQSQHASEEGADHHKTYERRGDSQACAATTMASMPASKVG